MALPLQYNLRNLGRRKVSTAMTLLGLAMVVLTFCVIQAFQNGLDTSLRSTGSPDTMIVIRHGSNAEVTSSVTRDAFRVISSLPEVAKDEKGEALAAAERYMTVYLLREDGKTRTNVALRGTSEKSKALRPSVRLLEGRWFKPGLQEIVVGRGVERRFPQLRMDGSVHFERRDWKIVGTFDADGGTNEGEIWADLEDVGNAFRRPEYSSAIVKARSTADVEPLRKIIEENPQLKLKPILESKYFSEQFEMGLPIAMIGAIITVMLAIGAMFGAMNTMYAAVAARTKEIAVLRAIGFGGGSVLLAFLIESVLLALVGGAIGCLLALPFDGIQTGTINWFSFTETAFQFRVTPWIMLNGMIFAACLGLLGGLLPALRAARMTILTALRAG